MAAVSRAGRRAAYHLLQAAIEGLKAVEAVIEEIGAVSGDRDRTDEKDTRQRIDVE